MGRGYIRKQRSLRDIEKCNLPRGRVRQAWIDQKFVVARRTMGNVLECGK